jgi:hypothetical protein
MVSTNAWPWACAATKKQNKAKENQSMHAVIRHHINDPAKWDRSVKNIMTIVEQHRLPSGFVPLQYLPSTDGLTADCLWEAESLGALQKFIDRETTGARNEYFEVKDESAIGLPKGEELARAA